MHSAHLQHNRDVQKREKKRTNIYLWIAQCLLTGIFLVAGSINSFQPIDFIMQIGVWGIDTPLMLIRFTGVVELMIAVGLIVPAVTRIAPRVSLFIAVIVVITMINAIIYQIVNDNYYALSFSVVILILAGYVTFGRGILEPLPPRELRLWGNFNWPNKMKKAG